MTRLALCLVLIIAPGLALAQDSTVQHGSMEHADHGDSCHAERSAGERALSDNVTEAGQAAFTAIQEIVALLMADPQTDWTQVDIESLRLHLIDMDNVTLRADVDVREIEGGARFEAMSDRPDVTASIRAMVSAHAAAMNGAEGWLMRADEIPGGAALNVTGADVQRIRALGFFGILTAGMHHQGHHFALASGQDPHDH